MSRPKNLANHSEPMISSPCISQCCLDDDDVCVGCFRHIDEITGWHSAENSQRQQILNNCAHRKELKPRPF